MIIIIPVGNVERRILKLIDRESYQLLHDRLAERPGEGVVMRGTGGMRKLRVAMNGRGKSGSARLIYYYLSSSGIIYLLDIFAKSDKADLTQSEKHQLKQLSRELSR